MWHWTTRTGQYPEAVAFTRRPTEAEPTVVDPIAETGTEPATETDPEEIRPRASVERYDLAG